MIKIIEKKPTLEEFKKLRDCVEWNLSEKGISDNRAQQSLDDSPYCICAYDDDKIVGMVRLTGDKSMYGYVQDTIVMPNYQGQGLGRKMMVALLNKVKNMKGYLIGTCPSKISVEFYKKLGFKKRPEEPNGFMYLEVGKDELKID